MSLKSEHDKALKLIADEVNALYKEMINKSVFPLDKYAKIEEKIDEILASMSISGETAVTGRIVEIVSLIRDALSSGKEMKAEWLSILEEQLRKRPGGKIFSIPLRRV
jgi:hypothetical protein